MNLKSALRKVFDTGYEIIDGTVVSVNEDKRTADIRIGDEDDAVILPGVTLRAVSNGQKDGILCVPAVGSYVVFAKICGESDYVLIKTSELDKLVIDVAVKVELNAPETVFNGGLNEGIIVINKLQAEIEKLNLSLEILKNATHAAIVPIDTIVSGTSGIFQTATSFMQSADLSNVTNDKVKH